MAASASVWSRSRVGPVPSPQTSAPQAVSSRPLLQPAPRPDDGIRPLDTQPPVNSRILSPKSGFTLPFAYLRIIPRTAGSQAHKPRITPLARARDITHCRSDTLTCGGPLILCQHQEVVHCTRLPTSTVSLRYRSQASVLTPRRTLPNTTMATVQHSPPAHSPPGPDAKRPKGIDSSMKI